MRRFRDNYRPLSFSSLSSARWLISYSKRYHTRLGAATMFYSNDSLSLSLILSFLPSFSASLLLGIIVAICVASKRLSRVEMRDGKGRSFFFFFIKWNNLHSMFWSFVFDFSRDVVVADGSNTFDVAKGVPNIFETTWQVHELCRAFRQETDRLIDVRADRVRVDPFCGQPNVESSGIISVRRLSQRNARAINLGSPAKLWTLLRQFVW